MLVVFDKAYNVYWQFAKWTQSLVWFVTRMKDNAIFHVTKVMVDNTRKKDAQGVLKEQYVTIGFPRKRWWSYTKPLDDRTLVQTDIMKWPFRLF